MNWRQPGPAKIYEFDRQTNQYLTQISTQLFQCYQDVRDLLVFSCYTGISYIDIMNLTEDNILLGIDGGNWVFTHRQKTKRLFEIRF